MLIIPLLVCRGSFIPVDTIIIRRGTALCLGYKGILSSILLKQLSNEWIWKMENERYGSTAQCVSCSSNWQLKARPLGAARKLVD